MTSRILAYLVAAAALSATVFTADAFAQLASTPKKAVEASGPVGKLPICRTPPCAPKPRNPLAVRPGKLVNKQQ